MNIINKDKIRYKSLKTKILKHIVLFYNLLKKWILTPDPITKFINDFNKKYDNKNVNKINNKNTILNVIQIIVTFIFTFIGTLFVCLVNPFLLISLIFLGPFGFILFFIIFLIFFVSALSDMEI